MEEVIDTEVIEEKTRIIKKCATYKCKFIVFVISTAILMNIAIILHVVFTEDKFADVLLLLGFIIYFQYVVLADIIYKKVDEEELPDRTSIKNTFKIFKKRDKENDEQPRKVKWIYNFFLVVVVMILSIISIYAGIKYFFFTG